MGFESWLEREHLMMLDFDPARSAKPEVGGIWAYCRRHAPDPGDEGRDPTDSELSPPGVGALQISVLDAPMIFVPCRAGTGCPHL